MCAVLSDPNLPERDWMMERVGSPIAPEAFNWDEVTARLARQP